VQYIWQSGQYISLHLDCYHNLYTVSSIQKNGTDKQRSHVNKAYEVVGDSTIKNENKQIYTKSTDQNPNITNDVPSCPKNPNYVADDEGICHTFKDGQNIYNEIHETGQNGLACTIHTDTSTENDQNLDMQHSDNEPTDFLMAIMEPGDNDGVYIEQEEPTSGKHCTSL